MSASPAPSGEAANQERTTITFQFCRECSNLLYPKENRATNELRFECRTCRWDTAAPSACVYRNELSNQVGETAGITQDIGQDPTLPRQQIACPACGEHDAVFFQSQQRTAETGMKLYFVCTSCGNVWQ